MASRRKLRAQQGAVLLVMLVIMVMGGLAFLVSALNNRSGSQIERDQLTLGALNQAKEALVAYAVSNDTRPGNLPCPDRDAPNTSGYGTEDSPCSSSGKTSIGRLPWKTLGIPELVDATGEPLWYAISDNFRSSAGTINSDTQGTLSVYDNAGTLLTPSGSEAVAVVFSPGSPAGSQARSSQSALCATTNTNIAPNLCASNYLESANGRNNASATGPFISANKTDTFNDHLVFITPSQLAQNIERRVAKTIESEIKPMIAAYYAGWHAYPFAAPFSLPSSSTFIGQASTYYGLLPVGNIVNITPRLQWRESPLPRYYVDGVYTGDCSFSTSNGIRYLRCGNNSSPYTTVPAGKTITFTGVLLGVGFGFWQPHDVTNTAQVEVRNAGGSYLLASNMLTSPTITTSLNSDGSANITFSGIGKTGGTILRRVRLSNDIQSADTSDLELWLLDNNWHQLMYYAASSGYAPGGGNTCNALPATPSCLTINGSNGGNDKRALVVMMGIALQGKSHTSNSSADYLEGSNTTHASGIYENKTLATDFNDKVISVAP